MKLIVFWGAVVLLIVLMFPLAGAEPLLLADDALQIRLTDLQRTPEGARVCLCCSDSGAADTVRFLIPCVNGEYTVFASMWASEEIRLSPGKETRAELELLLPEKGGTAENLSFRVAFRDRLSEPVKLDLSRPSAVRTVSFHGTEPQITASAVVSSYTQKPSPIRISDRLTIEQLLLLDYGQAWICLRTEEGLVPFCKIRLKADQLGRISAVYSGLAWTFSSAPETPLTGREETENGVSVFRSDAIHLTGDAVFFADYALTLKAEDDGSCMLAEQRLTSDEMGGSYTQAPLDLFDQAQLLLRLLENSAEPRETASVRTILLPLSEPLALQVRNAAELGELRIYCEYFFTDGSDVVHPVYDPFAGNQSGSNP